MSLSFLVPLFLLGIAGIVVPIVVHLTRRQRRNVVLFPSLMFLEKVPYREQRRRRIQHWFLLALRALALILLAVAFARPFMDDTALAAGGNTGPREIVVLVDRSYSMAAGDRWERALEEARRAFADLGPLDRVSLVAFAQGADVLLRSTTDVARLRTVLDTVRVGSEVTRYGPALKVAQSILEESTLPSGEVHLVSDFQRTGWAGDEGVRLPAGTVFKPVVVAGEAPDNVGVTGVSLARQSVSGRERVTPTVRLIRRGGEGSRDVTVTLELDGQPIQTSEARLDPNGAATVTFSPFTLSQPHTRGSVRVPEDAIPADDARHFVVSPGAALQVLVVEAPNTRSDVSLFLLRALGISDDGRFDVRVRRSATIPSAELDAADAVVLNDARVDGPSADRLRAFVESGGGVLVALGENTGWPASAADLLPGVIGPVQDRVQGRGGRLGHLDYGHPIFEVFAGARSGDFTGSRFFRARAFAPGDSAAVVARFDDGSVALAEQRTGEGTVLVWTSSLDSFWNDLALQPVYLPFVHRLVEHVAGRAEALQSFGVGQVVDLADPDALEAAGLVSVQAAGIVDGADQVALTPEGGSVPLPAGAGPRYLPLRERGFYTVRPPGSDPSRPFVLAVNVDVSESNLTAMDPEELSLAVVASEPAPGEETSFAEAASLRLEDQERRQSLWRGILLLAFALLALETGLSNWVSRRTGGTPGMATG